MTNISTIFGRRGAGVAAVLVIVVAAVAVVAVAVWYVTVSDDFRLSSKIRIDELVADLLTEFEQRPAAPEAAGTRVSSGVLEPGDSLSGGGTRRAILMPAPSSQSFWVAVPEDAVLVFGVGVEGLKKRDRGAAGVRFSISIEGREAYSRVVNPAATRHHRRWFDERVRLGVPAGQRVEITLATDTVGSGERPAGTPGWSNLRVVRETWRDRQPASRAAPNVIVLLIDTLRADRLGCYGASPSPSPTLDELARQGLVFEESVSQSSWTPPSVASLFTGLYPRTHGVIGSWRGDGEAPSALFLSDELRTWAEVAQSAGITTVAVVSNPLISGATNLAQGFETFVELDWDSKREDSAEAAEINQVFLRWLRQNRHHRFVAYLHYMDPHEPYIPPARLQPPVPAGTRRRIAAGRPCGRRGCWGLEVKRIKDAAENTKRRLTDAEIAHLRRLYDAEIRSWDNELAALLRGLEDFGIRDSTTLIITADHGEEFREHRRLGHGSHLYEETVRVPLVLVGPSIRSGRVREPVQGIDLFPTLLSLLGLPPPPPELPGQDVLAMQAVRPVFAETHNAIAPDGKQSHLVSLRVLPWKLIHAPAEDRFELYDLRRDPGEQENQFEAAPQASALAAELAAWQATIPKTRPSTVRQPQLYRQLRALGYVD
jgi:arylsulfatase A-like enzyme